METVVIPLGVGSAMPTQGRHFASMAVAREECVLLFDCGEGTQFRVRDAGLKITRIKAVFITHLHGDHFYGLPGLLSTLSLLRHEKDITIVGPEGIEEVLAAMPGLAREELPYTIRFTALKTRFTGGVVWEQPDFKVFAAPLDHTVFTVGYRYEEKDRPGKFDAEGAKALGVTEVEQIRSLASGEAIQLASGTVVDPSQVVGPARPGSSFAYVTDTRPTRTGVWLARDADLLYHEATFMERLNDKARITGHATAKEAATIARDAGVNRLLIGHFSARYDEATDLVDEARETFAKTDDARELKRYILGRDTADEPASTA